MTHGSTSQTSSARTKSAGAGFETLAIHAGQDPDPATGAVVPAGHGDGQVLETVRALRANGFDGFFSLEPHLGIGHRMGGFSGPALFTKAWRAFTEMLSTEGIQYR